MPKKQKPKKTTSDQLIKTGKNTGVELKEEELKRVTGGFDTTKIKPF
jgi:hypothetical protein